MQKVEKPVLCRRLCYKAFSVYIKFCNEPLSLGIYAESKVPVCAGQGMPDVPASVWAAAVRPHTLVRTTHTPPRHTNPPVVVRHPTTPARWLIGSLLRTIVIIFLFLLEQIIHLAKLINSTQWINFILIVVPKNKTYIISKTNQLLNT